MWAVFNCLFYACSFSIYGCLSLMFDSILKYIKAFEYGVYFIFFFSLPIFNVLIAVALNAYFRDHPSNNWWAAIGTSNGEPVLYSSSATDVHNFICQYNCE